MYEFIDKNGNISANSAKLVVIDKYGKVKEVSTGGGGGSPTGPAGGDLSGTYPNPSVRWNNGTSTYNLLYYPLSSNPAGYLTSSALTPYLTTAAAALTYYPIPTGTTSQYIRGDGSLATFTTYALPIATASVLGGVKIGSGVSVALDGTISVSTNYQAPLLGTGFVKSTAGVISYDTTTYYPYPTGTVSQYIDGTGAFQTFPTIPTTPTLQEVLDNNHDLVDGNNFQGTTAGDGNTGSNNNAFGAEALNGGAGSDNNAFGSQASTNNQGNYTNALGNTALRDNTADYVNALGAGAGDGNTFKNVNLFGFRATADAENQTVFSKWISGVTKYLGRLSFNNITADRKWELPDADGTIALTTDITTPSLQQTITVNKTADEIELLYTFFTGKAFTPATAPVGFLLYLIGIELAQNGGYYIYGNFSGYDGFASNDIVKVLPNGNVDTSFVTGTGLNNWPFSGTSLLEDDFGKLYISGAFTTFNSVSANRILKLNTDGSRDNSFVVGSGFNDYTLGLAFNVAKTAIYVTGTYTTYKTVSQVRLAKLLLNGDIDPSFIIGSGFNDATISVVVNSDDTLFITTYASTYKTLAIPNIIKLLPNGDRDFSFVSGIGFNTVPNQPNYIIKTPDNKLIAVGFFTSYNGTAANRIIKLNQDGTIDNSFVVGAGFDNSLSNIQLVDNNTKYLCIGSFTSFKGVATNGAVLIDLFGNIIETYVNKYSASLYVNNALLTLALSGTNINKLVFIKDDVEYLTLNQSLTFDKTNGKAEYNLSPNLVYEDLGENELVPKKFITRSIAKTTSFTAVNSGVYNTNGTITVTDAVPETNQGYIVYVIGGTTTIGGVGYTTGSLVYRFFNGTAWTSKDYGAGGGAGTVTSIATTGPITGGTITTSGTIGITQATTSTDGYLSATDWNTFNNKQNASTRRNANNSTNNNINYCGVALGTGVSESATVWTITRLTISYSGSITTGLATNVAWTNRESVPYT